MTCGFFCALKTSKLGPRLRQSRINLFWVCLALIGIEIGPKLGLIGFVFDFCQTGENCIIHCYKYAYVQLDNW